MTLQGRELISIDEAVERYSLTKSFFWKHCSAKDIPYHRIGRRNYFDLEELEAWLLTTSRVEKI